MVGAAKNNNSFFAFFRPKTKNFLLEGMRLALLNTVLILFGGGFSFGLLRGAEYIRGIGFPLPLPLWLIFLPLGAAYYIAWFKYGKSYGRLIRSRRFLKGLVIGIIGQLPGFAIMYLLMTRIREDLLIPELIRIGLIIIITLSIVLPIMVGLGSLDQKK
jgi:hypothetical protein